MEKRKYTKKLKPEAVTPGMEVGPMEVGAVESEAPVAPTEAVNSPIPAPVPTPVNGPAITSDAWHYHEAEEPRIFKAGEVVPGGWHSSMKPLKRAWANTAEGKWIRKNK